MIRSRVSADSAGHRAITTSSSGSAVGVRASTAPDSAPPPPENCVFPEVSWGRSSPLSSTRHKALCDKKLHKVFLLRSGDEILSHLPRCCAGAMDDAAKRFAERWASGGTIWIGKRFLSPGSRCFDRAPHGNIRPMSLPLSSTPGTATELENQRRRPRDQMGHYREKEVRTISSAICLITSRAD